MKKSKVKGLKDHQIDWQGEVLKLRPTMFKILTPNGHGTGFLIFKNDKNVCGIATAYHVISHAIDWKEPIKLKQFSTSRERFLEDNPNVRVVKYDESKDLALIMFINDGTFDFECTLPDLTEVNQIVDQGTQIGWNGFPVIAPNDLCFFSGYISSHIKEQDSYLVDGVAINGVSGAPAFFPEKETGKIKICGVISNYFPNTSTGQSLPGLSMIRSVTPLKLECESLKSLDEANKKTEEEVKPELES